MDQQKEDTAGFTEKQGRNGVIKNFNAHKAKRSKIIRSLKSHKLSKDFPSGRHATFRLSSNEQS